MQREAVFQFFAIEFSDDRDLPPLERVEVKYKYPNRKSMAGILFYGSQNIQYP